MIDGDGTLLYVGKAKWLRARLLSYFRSRSRDPKAGRILANTRAIVWEHAPSEFAALLRELELIRRWQPVLNVRGQPQRRRRGFVCLGKEPAPYVYLSARPLLDASACFGPIPASWRSREAIRHVNDWYRLRDCPQPQAVFFADQRGLFPDAKRPGCLCYELGTCVGTCIGGCSRRAYLGQVKAARAFLEGTSVAILDHFEQGMSAASASLQFERASAIRDKLDVLRWLHGHLTRLRSIRAEHSFIYAVPSHDGRGRWYAIQHGRVLQTLLAPHGPADKRKTLEQLARLVGREQEWGGPTPAEEFDAVLLVASWFRRHPEERRRTFQLASKEGNHEAHE